MYNLDLEKAEEPEIILPTFIGSWRKQASSRKNIYFYSTDYVKVLTVWITTDWKILKEIGIPEIGIPEIGIPLYLSPEKHICRSRSNMEQRTASKLGKEYHKVVY